MRTELEPSVTCRLVDASKIAFICDRDGQQYVYLMNPDGSDVTRLTRNPITELRLSWSLEGRKMSFCGYADYDELSMYVINVP